MKRRSILGLLLVLGWVSFAGSPQENQGLKLAQKVILNQKKVNLQYDAQALITFYDNNGNIKTQREITSRYTVKEGIIVDAQRIGYAESLPAENSSDNLPKYRESRILPFFSPLSEKALPYYRFTLRGENQRKAIATYVVDYEPIEELRDLSRGTIWISKADLDLVALESHAIRDFTFTDDFTMTMEYRKERGMWVPQSLLSKLSLNILAVYKRRVIFDQKVINRYF